MLTAHILIASLLLPSSQPQTPREYVIREVKPPLVMDSRYNFSWRGAWFSGDSDLNGESDFLFGGYWLPEPSSGLSVINYFDFRTGLDPAESTVFYDRQAAYGLSPAWAFLKTPTGSQALILRTGLGPNVGLVSFDWDTGIEIGIVPPPTGFPPNVPDPGQFEFLFSAGDQDGDGFEDFFWTSYRATGTGFSYCGLYSGATLSSIWQWGGGKSAGPMPPYFSSPGLLPDLNGDGFADILIGVPRAYPVESHSYIAFSGQDGSVIWREDAPSWMGALYGFGPDLSGDGIPDPVFLETTPLQFRALDGTDGTELWVSPLASLEAQYSGSYIGGTTQWRGFMSNLDHPNLQEYVNYHWVDSGSSILLALAHYDAYDGTFLGSFQIPSTLEPWSIDSTWASGMAAPPFSLGDIDRDGLEEIGLPVKDWQRSPAWSINGSNPSPGAQLAIVGLKTLFVPDIHQLSANSMAFDIAVPAGVNKDFVILVSTAFDPYGGMELGPWKTFLAPSRVLDYTFHFQRIHGTLDADGKGSALATVPQHPALLGATLYSKAIILNPPGSPERILTMSSMGITELQ
jgi:hypothetical protein